MALLLLRGLANTQNYRPPSTGGCVMRLGRLVFAFDCNCKSNMKKKLSTKKLENWKKTDKKLDEIYGILIMRHIIGARLV